jgi:hypothetical protein
MERNASIRAVLAICALSLALPLASPARTLYVDDDAPADFKTIQAAIDAAADGDTILLRPGTYTGDGNRDIDFKGKAITVKSEGGAATCTINCQGSTDEPHRAFYFHDREDADSVVQGFTITGGFITEGPSFWAGSGGGIHCYASSPRIVDCIITGNIASIGGGVACVDSNSVLIGCTITANETRAAREPPMSFTRSLGSGGGVAIIRSCPVLANCLIAGNRASYDGGGVLCAGDFAIVNCTISGNRASRYGYGGGICVMGSRSDHGVLRNCILWANTAGACDQIFRGFAASILGANRLEVTYCTIQDEQPRSCLYSPQGHWTSDDPIFANPGYWDPNGTPDDPNDGFWVEGDYHLKSQAGRWDPISENWVKDDVTSPCIDTGDPNNPIGEESEPNGGRVNMGAYGGTAEASKSYIVP